MIEVTVVSYLVEHGLHVGIRHAGLVEGVEGEGGTVLVSQRKHLVLQANEVDILVVQFLHLYMKSSKKIYSRYQMTK